MNFHLDRKIKLNDQTEHKSLYSWCLQEIDGEGKQIGRDLIPWEWSSYFTVSELNLNQGVEFGDPQKAEENEGEAHGKFSDTENITANLHPGICNDGEWLESATTFSMFGTDRAVTQFTLRISKVGSDEAESCGIWGGVSYTTEIDFHDETAPDSIEIYLRLSKDRFNKLAYLISSKVIDVARIRLGRVAGFYSDWSPSISTDSIKVLARGNEHKIDSPAGCKIKPPRLGKIGELNFTLIARRQLDPKQNFQTLNISKLFENELEMHENEEIIDEEEDVSKLLLTQIANGQYEIQKIRKPLWLVVILLTLLLISVWF